MNEAGGDLLFMHERNREVTGEHLIGVQEAATYLGIHRATLFRALSSGVIVADYRTPRGQARFRQETINAFKEQLQAQATGYNHADVSVRVLARLARLSSGTSPSTNPIRVIKEVIRSFCPPVGLFDMVVLAIRVPDKHDPFALRVLAEQGFPKQLKAAYACLRPCEEFPVNRAMSTGAPAICDDIRSHPFPHTSALRAMTQNGIISYAAFPIATGSGRTRAVIGTLVVCGRAPYKFSRRDELFLGAVADALSACITNSALRATIIQTDDANALDSETALTVASDLLEAAYDHAWSLRVGTQSVSGIKLLCDLFERRSYALATLVDGFPLEACGANSATGEAHGDGQESEKQVQYLSNLRSLVVRTRSGHGVKWEQWSEATAVALPVPLPSGAPGAVGAVWPGRRVEVVAEEILLSTLASACAVVSQYTMMESDYAQKRA